MVTGNNPDDSQRQNLSVFIFKDGFCLYIYDDNKNVLIEKAFQLTDTFNSKHCEKVLIAYNRQKFGKIKLIFYPEKFTLIPDEYFNVADVNKYYEFNIGPLHDDDILYYVKSDKLGFYSLFSFNRNVFNFFTSHFSEAKITVSISSFLDEISNKPINAVYTYKVQNILNIAVYKDGIFQSANSFNFSSDSDLIYYILYAFKLYNMNPETDHIYLCGNFKLRNELSKYVNNIDISNENSKWLL